jgi:hypothetical protein
MSGNPNFGNDPLDYGSAGNGSVTSLTDASTGFNSGWTFDIPKTPDTATVNAIQSMAPATASNTASGSDFSDFWRGLAGSVVNTGLAVVAKQNGVVQVASNTPAVTPPPNPNRHLILFVLLGVGAVLLFRHEG